jgi:hypothetical protein
VTHHSDLSPSPTSFLWRPAAQANADLDPLRWRPLRIRDVKEIPKPLGQERGGVLTSHRFDGATGFEHVLEQTNFLVGDPVAAFEKVRAEIFADHLPASTSVFVQALVSPECHCEIKLVAVVPG